MQNTPDLRSLIEEIAIAVEGCLFVAETCRRAQQHEGAEKQSLDEMVVYLLEAAVALDKIRDVAPVEKCPVTIRPIPHGAGMTPKLTLVGKV